VENIYLRCRHYLIKRLHKIINLLRTPARGIYPFAYYNAQLEKKMVDEFVRDGAIWCNDGWEIKSICIDNLTVNGLIMEFGVYQGNSINYIADRIEGEVHGFDGFQGLPDGRGPWASYVKRKAFDLKGKLPTVRSNVRLHQGWFKDTLPAFLENHAEPARFIHVDCDVYSSTKTILTLLADRIVPGTVILFDEYCNYDGWQFEEYKAFQEFVNRHNVGYKVLAVDTYESEANPFGKVAFLIKSITHQKNVSAAKSRQTQPSPVSV